MSDENFSGTEIRVQGTMQLLMLVVAMVLMTSILFPWRTEYIRGIGGDWVSTSPLEPEDYTADQAARFFAPLSGLIALVGAFLAVIRPSARRMGICMAFFGFAIAALVLTTMTEATKATFGIGAWSSHVLGGTHSNGPSGREVYGWGAGMAVWGTLVGVAACTTALLRAAGGNSGFELDLIETESAVKNH